MEGCTGAARPAPAARRRHRSRTARLDLRTARREATANGTGRRCEPGRGWRLPPDASSEDCRSGRERRQVQQSRVGGDRGLAPPPGFARRTPPPATCRRAPRPAEIGSAQWPRETPAERMCPQSPASGAAANRPPPRPALWRPAWWAPSGFAAIPTTALDPPHSAASSAVPALVGSGSPSWPAAGLSARVAKPRDSADLRRGKDCRVTRRENTPQK